MMKLLVILAVCGVLLYAGPVSAGDPFVSIKAVLSDAACVEMTFLSILESDIFDHVDSAFGTAYIARDGRYTVTVGGDRYLFDLEHLYNYSPQTNQVTVERAGGGAGGSAEVSFVTRLDDYYRTTPLRPGESYRLIRADSSATNVPDSLLVFIDTVSMHLASVEYYDVNEELNRIIITEQITHAFCDSSRFLPNFPDSCEVIKLW